MRNTRSTSDFFPPPPSFQTRFIPGIRDKWASNNLKVKPTFEKYHLQQSNKCSECNLRNLDLHSLSAFEGLSIHSNLPSLWLNDSCHVQTTSLSMVWVGFYNTITGKPFFHPCQSSNSDHFSMPSSSNVWSQNTIFENLDPITGIQVTTAWCSASSLGSLVHPANGAPPFSSFLCPPTSQPTQLYPRRWWWWWYWRWWMMILSIGRRGKWGRGPDCM